jgi:hypothetical protein
MMPQLSHAPLPQFGMAYDTTATDRLTHRRRIGAMRCRHKTAGRPSGRNKEQKGSNLLSRTVPASDDRQLDCGHLGVN